VEASVVRLNQTTAGVEAPSGKAREDENFPVGSMLISKKLRPYVHAFYAFARNADDIADSSELPEAEKISRLNAMEDILLGRRTSGSTTSTLLRARLAELQITNEHARDLLHAFRQDASKSRYASWSELMEYCRYSAMPVGRFMLDLHGETRDAWPHSDALCSALQVLNHLQDCAEDLALLDRCYLPADLLAEHQVEIDDVRRPAETEALRRVFNTLLAKCDELNRAAAPLPGRVRNRRLRMECAVICTLARRLTWRLKRGDPLATRVALRRVDYLFGGGAALRALA
jgi:farnesyl-diphosphate farnesyltransferase